MIDSNLSKVAELYTENIRRIGSKSDAVGWTSEDGQRLRFEKLCTLIKERDDDESSISDYGCGYGSLLEYLVRERQTKVQRYVGYDVSEDMLDAARKQLDWFDGQLDLINSEIVDTVCDYAFVSGTFNVKFDASVTEWRESIEKALDNLHENTRKGFAFNLLSTYVDYMEDHLFYGDPCYWFDLCKRKYSKFVSLHHDYPLWEWTIVVNKSVD